MLEVIANTKPLKWSTAPQRDRGGGKYMRKFCFETRGVLECLGKKNEVCESVCIRVCEVHIKQCVDCTEITLVMIRGGTDLCLKVRDLLLVRPLKLLIGLLQQRHLQVNRGWVTTWKVCSNECAYCKHESVQACLDNVCVWAHGSDNRWVCVIPFFACSLSSPTVEHD